MNNLTAVQFSVESPEVFSQKKAQHHKGCLAAGHGDESRLVYRCILVFKHNRADDPSDILHLEVQPKPEAPPLVVVVFEAIHTGFRMPGLKVPKVNK